MLFGEYEHQLDEKYRMRLPVKLKNKLGEKYVITKGSNHCLFVFSQTDINDIIAEKLNSLPISDIKAQKSIRMLFSSGYEVEEDSQGRFLLTTRLREFANIEKNVISIGAGNRVEIWDREAWEQYNKDCDFDKIFGELSEYGV